MFGRLQRAYSRWADNVEAAADVAAEVTARMRRVFAPDEPEPAAAVVRGEPVKELAAAEPSGENDPQPARAGRGGRGKT